MSNGMGRAKGGLGADVDHRKCLVMKVMKISVGNFCGPGLLTDV
jgi:hypothetical protein